MSDKQPEARNRRLLSSRQMSFDRLKRLTTKELREILRDRRTVVTLILMPLLVYPLLSLVFHRFLFSALPSEKPQVVVVVNESYRGDLLQLLQTGEQLLDAEEQFQREEDEGAVAPPVEDAPPSMDDITKSMLGQVEPEILVAEADDPALAVRELRADLAVVFPEDYREYYRRPPENGLRSRPPPLQIHVRPLSTTSRMAQRYVEDRLNAANDAYYRMILLERRTSPQPPGRFRRVTVASEGSSGVSLATLAPLILILMTMTGAVYPAIDLTAGERERGTLETLMAAPAPRIGILFAKYIAVLVVAMLTATVNMTAMTATIFVSGLGPRILGDGALTLPVMLQIFALLLLFGSFFSAVLLTITSMARSFKEAQSYLIPLMLISLAPGILGAMPGLEFSPILSITPLVNIVLLARDLLNGQANPTFALMAVGSTLLYTAAALSLAASIFGGDAVLYGAQGSWKSMLRRPESMSQRASIATSAFCLAAIFPLYFLISGLLSQVKTADIQQKILLAGLATPLVFGLTPWFALRWRRVRILSGVGWFTPGWLSFPAAMLLGLSMWPFAHELVVLAEQIGIGSLDTEQLKGVEQMLEKWKSLPVWAILLAFAAGPAIFEELFFRGVFFGSLERRVSPTKAILISGLLFGAFHVVGGSVLAIERLLPSAMIGIMLGYLRYRSGSVIPGIVAHMLHNGFLLSVVYFRDELMARGIGIENEEHLPLSWLAAAVFTLAIGLGLMQLLRPSEVNASSDSDDSEVALNEGAKPSEGDAEGTGAAEASESA